ncbi:Hypothetical protein A7982_07848 [Minicystis rosea]|nr:Hypothetical protein A7982_07848 [Minicystis rosea]
MGFSLRSTSSGETLRVSGGHWAVFLTLAEAYGWKPAGTQPPRSLPPGKAWHGRYDSSDGQTVTDADAKRLAEILHGAAVSKEIAFAVTDTIARIERSAEAEGLTIPAGMRMRFEDFREEFSPLLLFLYKGEFVIDGEADRPAPPASPAPASRVPPASPAPASRVPPASPVSPASSASPPPKLMPFVHNPMWAGWQGAAYRQIGGGYVDASTPLFGLAAIDGGVARPLSGAELLAIGDPAELEAQALANLEREPYQDFEVVEMTKGILGFRKAPLTVASRGPWAAERVLSPAFREAARARLGNPMKIAVAIPNKETILVRNHDVPHSATAHDGFGARVLEEFNSGRAPMLCNGIASLEGNSGWGSGYARLPTAFWSDKPAPYETRAVSDPPRALYRAKDAELEPAPAFAPTEGMPLRLRGRHRQTHRLEFELLARSAREVDEATRALLARAAGAYPGTVVAPITVVLVILPENVQEADYERILRHPHVLLCVPTGKKNELRRAAGSTTHVVSDNLSRPLSVLAAEGYL